MDDVTQLKQNAVKNIHQASYLFSTTYKMIKEPKALLSISQHIYSSFMNSISALLAHERSQRTIPPYHDTDESKLQAFKNYVSKKYNLQEYETTIERVNLLLQDHKSAVVEFSRGTSYVMCADQFSKVDSISETDVETYIKKAKEFFSAVERIAA